MEIRRRGRAARVALATAAAGLALSSIATRPSVAAPVPARGGQPTTASVRAAMDAVWAANRAYTPGMCLGVVDRSVKLIRCYGKTIPGPNGTRPNQDTLWEIGSASKTFTATLFALRTSHAAPGSTVVPLRSRIAGYVPAVDGKVNIPRRLTLKMLAQHYAGLPQSFTDWSAITSIDALYTTLSECYVPGNSCQVVNNPGSTWSYSNLGFDWLGAI